ncbi:unnamed protein product [Trichogramma brassicae]|uniref:RNA-directed DNA polymerase n=1 Tax=Trichogramma brassicae TaxID=86971 RepID=A0A6H5IE20_9HYME|nr:unnamed protein product [Trichogramma brassicae]
MAEAKIADRAAFDNDPPKNFQRFPDFSREIIVTTDASNSALGAVLSQGKIGSDLPVAYASRGLAKAELNYAAIEKELLAIVFAVQHFRPYLYGREFTIVTDHKPLVWLHNLKNPTSRLARWKEKLRDYDYEIVHKPGRVNANADALSRNPVPISSPNPISPRADDYEHEIKRRIFSINCLPEVRKRESHQGLAKDGQKVNRQGELARPGGSPQGTAGARESLRQELNPDLELIKTQQLNVGAITESGLSSGHSLFFLFIRNNHEETPDIDVLSEVITNLGAALVELGRTSMSIAQSYEHLDDMYWLPIETHLEELATSLHLYITICTGEVVTPIEEDRPNIIREAHDSAVAGHKGMIKTYHQIRERYYWPNMMDEIRRYVKTCHDYQTRKLT